MKDLKTMNQILNSAIIGVGTNNKSMRKVNVEALINGLPKASGVKLDGANLIINLSTGVEAESDFQNRLSEVINGHRVTYTKSEVGHRLLVVDLLDPRV